MLRPGTPDSIRELHHKKCGTEALRLPAWARYHEDAKLVLCVDCAAARNAYETARQVAAAASRIAHRPACVNRSER